MDQDLDIYFVPYLKSEIFRLDINESKLVFAFASNDITIGYGPHLCALSKTKIFFQGGVVNNEFISDSFVIDLANGEVAEKAFGPINAGGTCVVYRGTVYIFGGATREIFKPSPLSQCYNIAEDFWSELSPLPIASYNNTGTLCAEGKIALVGQHLFHLYYYLVSECSYTTDLPIRDNYKLVVSHEGKLFVIGESTVKALEGHQWKEYPHAVGLFTLIYSYPVIRGEWIYMVVPPQDTLRLNVNTKKLEKVQTNIV